MKNIIFYVSFIGFILSIFMMLDTFSAYNATIRLPLMGIEQLPVEGVAKKYFVWGITLFCYTLCFAAILIISFRKNKKNGI